MVMSSRGARIDSRRGPTRGPLVLRGGVRLEVHLIVLERAESMESGPRLEIWRQNESQMNLRRVYYCIE